MSLIALAEVPSAQAVIASVNQTVEANFRVLRQFRQVFNSVRGHFQQVEKKVGVGGSQVWALEVIHRHPGIGVNGLAAAMDIHQTTASNLIKTMVKTGFVRTERNGADKRTVQLFIEAEGQQVLARAPGPASGVLPEALSLLDNDTLLRLESDLNRLLKLLDPDKSAAHKPLADM